MLKALCVGWITNSLQAVLALRGAGIETIIVNTEPDRFFERVPALRDDIPIALNLYQKTKIPKPKLSRYLFIVQPNIFGFAFSQKFVPILRQNKLDFVFAHWGVGVLPEVALVKSIAPELPVILNMETFPTAPSGGLRETTEQYILKRMAWAIDGLVIPTDEMASLIYKLVPSMEKKPIYTKPFYYPKEFAPTEFLKKLSAIDQRPHVVFMGQFDTRYLMNDVRQEILALANVGIIVHCARTFNLEHPNVVQFEPFSGEDLVSGKLTSYMTQFDACLVTYKTEMRPPLRFKTSLPSRFLIALAAGVPVVLPRGKFKAMQSFIEQEGIGLAYSDVKELYLTLMDPNWEKLQEKSSSKQKDFLFNAQELLHFVNVVLRQKGM